MFRGLDLYYAHPAQPLTTADEELDDLLIDHDLSDLFVRGVQGFLWSGRGEGVKRSPAGCPLRSHAWQEWAICKCQEA